MENGLDKIAPRFLSASITSPPLHQIKMARDSPEPGDDPVRITALLRANAHIYRNHIAGVTGIPCPKLLGRGGSVKREHYLIVADIGIYPGTPVIY